MRVRTAGKSVEEPVSGGASGSLVAPVESIPDARLPRKEGCGGLEVRQCFFVAFEQGKGFGQHEPCVPFVRPPGDNPLKGLHCTRRFSQLKVACPEEQTGGHRRRIDLQHALARRDRVPIVRCLEQRNREIQQ